MMTIEHRIVVGIEDIESVTLECTKCFVRVTYQPDKVPGIPKLCPGNCGNEWNPPAARGSDHIHSPFEYLAESIGKIRLLLNEGKAGFRILLEFKEPSL